MMSDQKDGESIVELAGKSRTLRMDFNALCRAEVLTGRNYISQQTWRDLNTRDYRALIFGCLVSGGDGEVTSDEVGSWLNPGNEDETSNAMTAILDLWFGKPKGEPPTVEPPIVDDAETRERPLATSAGAPAGP